MKYLSRLVIPLKSPCSKTANRLSPIADRGGIGRRSIAMNFAVSSKLASKYSGRRTKCIAATAFAFLFIEFQCFLNPSPQLWVSGMKFLRGQATRPGCFVTYDNAFSVAMAELGSAHKDAAALYSC